jgi:integrase
VGITKRTWFARGINGHRVKHVSFGYSVQIPCNPCPHRIVKDGVERVAHPDGVRQVREYDKAWTREDAEKARAARLLQPDVAPATPAKPKTLSEVGQEYLDFKRAKGKRTVAEDEAKLRRFKDYFGAYTLINDVTAQRIAGYERQRVTETSKRGEVVTPSTVNRELAMLRHMLRLAYEWGYIAKVPRIRMSREPEGRLRWLTQEEAAKLLQACSDSRNPYLHSIVVIALNTGARKAEILGLTWDRVDFSRGVLHFDKTKSGRRREVPMNRAVYDALSSLKGERVGRVFRKSSGAAWGSVRTAFESAVVNAGLQDFHFHDLRHTAASWLILRGRHLKEIQELLGHATLAMTMKYAHLSPDRLREAVASLDTPTVSTKSAQSTVESSEPRVSSDAPVAQLDRASDF